MSSKITMMMETNGLKREIKGTEIGLNLIIQFIILTYQRPMIRECRKPDIKKSRQKII